MTLNGAITELVMMIEHPMMPAFFKSSLDKVIETVSECEEPSPNSSESPNGWISCKKKLPEKSEKYEVTIKNVTTIFDGETGEVVERVGYYVDCDIYKGYLLRKWHRYDGGQVIAWRKLPEPYQPEEDES